MSNETGQTPEDAVTYWELQALRVVLSDLTNGTKGHVLADNGVCISCGAEFVTVTVQRSALIDAERINSVPNTEAHFGPVLAADRTIERADSILHLVLGISETVNEDNEEIARDGN